MKTFNCTQCGASITQLSLKDRWAHCEYCKARFLLPEERRNVVQGLSFGLITASDPVEVTADFGRIWIGAICVAALALIVSGGVMFQQQAKRAENTKLEQKRKERERLSEQYRVTKVPVKVDWEGQPEDVSYYLPPPVDSTTLALARQYETSPGSSCVVVVEVKIDRDGYVTNAEIVSGNVILQPMAANAAGQMVFARGSKKKVRKVTFTFG